MRKRARTSLAGAEGASSLQGLLGFGLGDKDSVLGATARVPGAQAAKIASRAQCLRPRPLHPQETASVNLGRGSGGPQPFLAALAARAGDLGRVLLSACSRSPSPGTGPGRPRLRDIAAPPQLQGWACSSAARVEPTRSAGSLRFAVQRRLCPQAAASVAPQRGRFSPRPPDNLPALCSGAPFQAQRGVLTVACFLRLFAFHL